MHRKSNLYLLTFLSVFLSLFLVGTVLSPLFLKMIRSSYLEMNAQVNQRQTLIIADMIAKLLSEGEKKQDIIAALQASLVKTDMYRTYLCLVDDKTHLFLAHPMPYLVGQSANQFVLNYSAGVQKKIKKMVSSGSTKAFTPGVILTTGVGRTEIVTSMLIPQTNLRIFSHENINRLNKDIALYQKGFVIILIILGFLVAFPASYAALKLSRQYEKEINAEQEKSEKLLLNTLPASIAKRLKADERNIANQYKDVSVLFIDIVNFTPIASTLTPEELVNLLNHIFNKFDEISLKYGLEKIKTIGDAYLVASGLPEPKKDHLSSCIKAAIEMLDFIHMEYGATNQLNVRMGLHAGPVIAGVIGSLRFAYDLWGESVNIASRLETSSLPGCLHCSESVYLRMKDQYQFTPRGETLLKGMRAAPTYFLVTHSGKEHI